jgi:hypothetical protein
MAMSNVELKSSQPVVTTQAGDDESTAEKDTMDWQNEEEAGGNTAIQVECPILPCWDETDDGVPPFCRGPAPVPFWKVFNPLNRFTNDNLIMISFGNVGFKYFDKNRKYWMGAAMWSTLISIGFTVAGCFALSTNMQIIKNTNWVSVSAKNTTSGDQFLVHIGLRALVYTHEPCNVFHCTRDVYEYGSVGTWPNAFVGPGLSACRDVAFGTAFGAFTTCATLLFALMGTMNRMRFSSDANIQKMLGMITDFCGFMSLTGTLWNLGDNCYNNIDRNFRGEIEAEVWLGPGYWCYIVCLFGAFMRATFHWLTPMPKRGAGCVPTLPQSLVKRLDTDGDGKVSWKELKEGYAVMVAQSRAKKAPAAGAAAGAKKGPTIMGSAEGDKEESASKVV